jgi:GT2 family glycosyltransferase
MSLSVIINTYNRAPSLRRTLLSLRHQTSDRFEVVVVNGPSTDNTAAVLDEFAGAVRVGHCPEVHLSKSRNIGIALAAGEVVAFLDDDAIPEPTWAADLMAAYTSGSIGGAGGIVYDHTGFRLQYRYATCDRTGTPDFDAAPPFDACNRRGADPFIYLQGTNASFRRECLREIGGFDEEIEYYLDEVEVCMRILDLDFTIRPLAHAAVHHKYLASHLRSPKKVLLNPYPLVKNRCYFALQNGREGRSVRQIMRLLTAFAESLRVDCAAHFAAGRLSKQQRRFFLEQVDRGLRDGTERGLHGKRQWRTLPPPDRACFLPYPTIRPAERARTVCLLSPGLNEDVTRAAVELAAAGHEVHTVVRSGDTNRVDFEDGVWVHRLAPSERHVPELEDHPERTGLIEAAAFYREVDRIHARGALDIVTAPPASMLASMCALDARFQTLPVERPTQECLQAVVAPAASAEAPQVTERLAELLANAAALEPEAARRAATTLLDPACYPVDYPAQVLRLWRQPDDAFVRGLFLLLFGREADPPTLDHYLRLLARGMPRRAVVRHLALSREAAENRLPLFWLAAAERLLPTFPRRRVRLLDRLRVLATRLAWGVKHRLRPQRRAS